MQQQTETALEQNKKKTNSTVGGFKLESKAGRIRVVLEGLWPPQNSYCTSEKSLT